MEANGLPKQTKEAILKTMDEFMMRPISTLFNEPVRQGTDTDEDYYSVIKNPIDLSTIKKKVESNSYNHLQDWVDDIELCWTNAETFNSNNQIFIVLIQECRRRIKKEMRKNGIVDISTWCSEVYRLRQKNIELFSQPPPKVKVIAPNLGGSHSSKPTAQLFTERDMKNLIEASNLLTSDENHKEFVRIISQSSPDVDVGSKETTIDLRKLNLSTLHALRDYMKDALSKLAQKYPE